MNAHWLVRVISLKDAPQRSQAVGIVHLALAIGSLLMSGDMVISPLSSVALTQLLQYALGFGGPLILFFAWVIYSPQFALSLGVRGRLNMRTLGLALLGIVLGLVLVQSMNMVGLWIWDLLGKPAPEVGHQVFKAMQTEHGVDIFYRAFTAVIFAPLCEETFFRGLLQTGTQNLFSLGGEVSPPLRVRCVLGVALAFGLVHIGAVPIPFIPSLIAFGILLGWFYEKTGCFWLPVLIHMGFNATSFGLGLAQN